jgi:hypothetical protein
MGIFSVFGRFIENYLRNLTRIKEIKDLGVILDSKMTFLCHIEAVIPKSSRM